MSSKAMILAASNVIGKIKHKIYIWLCLRDTINYLKKHPSAYFRIWPAHPLEHPSTSYSIYSDDLEAAYDFIACMSFEWRRKLKIPWDWKFYSSGHDFRKQLLKRAMQITKLFTHKDYVGVQ